MNLNRDNRNEIIAEIRAFEAEVRWKTSKATPTINEPQIAPKLSTVPQIFSRLENLDIFRNQTEKIQLISSVNNRQQSFGKFRPFHALCPNAV